MLKKYAFSFVAASFLFALSATVWAGDDANVDKAAPPVEVETTFAVDDVDGSENACDPCDPCAPIGCDPCASVCCDPCPTVCCAAPTYCCVWNDCNSYSQCGFRKHCKFRRGWNGGCRGFATCGTYCDPCDVGCCDPCAATCGNVGVYCAPARKHCWGKRRAARAWRSSCAVGCYSSVNYCGYSSGGGCGCY